MLVIECKVSCEAFITLGFKSKPYAKLLRHKELGWALGLKGKENNSFLQMFGVGEIFFEQNPSLFLNVLELWQFFLENLQIKM